ncbi:MAG: YCF48-related protein [Pseudomonadota bacterium]|nr:YCF48-related protein [Pseudomonadota bacterium]
MQRIRDLTGLAVLLLSFVMPVRGIHAEEVSQEPAIQAPLAAKSLLIDAARVGGKLLAVGERGHIVFSTDGGKTWDQASVPTQMTLTAVDFVDESLGWAVGHDAVVVHTEDGGKTWTLQHAAPDWEQPLLDVLFLDADRGLATGAYGLLMITDDGGVTWQKTMVDETLDWHLNSIVRLPNGVLLIAGESGTLARSADRGETWEILESPYVGSFFGCEVLDGGKRVLAYGLRGNAYISEDMGDSWSKVENPLGSNLYGGDHLPGGGAVLVGAGGTILKLPAGSTAFERVPYPAFNNLVTAVHISGSEVAIFGSRGYLPYTIE